MRRLLLGLSCVALLCAVLLLSGALALVTTYGNSMSPRMNEGDLVVVRPASGYAIGDVVAYRSSELERVVLHRVVAVDHGRYSMRGDHNAFTDPEQPTDRQMVGKELLHIPDGGVWLGRLTSPVSLGSITLALLTLGRSRAGRRHQATARRQRRRREGSPS